MNSQQGIRARLKSRQQGAVAIIVAICLVVLIGMLGLVMDLGHLYVAKSELQNAADAAALSGAKRLDGTLCGISTDLGDCGTTKGAVQLAIETAGLNNYDFNKKSVVINATNIRVGNCPNAGCMIDISEISSEGQAADKTFIEVNTGSVNFSTWFIHVLSEAIADMQTFGLAVAGRYSIHVMPMGVCAVKVGDYEQGFLRGVSYNIPQLNPLGVNADQIWINPIDSYPGDCDKNNATPTKSYPFVCGGRISPIISALPGKVYYDTGVEATLNGPLNSRFGDASSYTGGQACDPSLAPADANTTEYNFNKPAAQSTSPKNWMEPDPVQQSITIGTDKKESNYRKPFYYPSTTPPRPDSLGSGNFEKYGVLWAYNKEVNSAGTAYTSSQWATLYGGSAVGYDDTKPPYERDLTVSGQQDRRVINMLIMDCDPDKVETVKSCKALPVVSIGKFFMQTRANLPNGLYLEFAGEFETPLPPADIKLYR